MVSGNNSFLDDIFGPLRKVILYKRKKMTTCKAIKMKLAGADGLQAVLELSEGLNRQEAYDTDL